MRVLASATIAILCVALGGMTAQGASVGFGGHIHQRFVRLSDFSVDADGASHEQPMRYIMRARLGAEMSFSRQFWIRSELQLLDGQVLGAESPVPAGPRGELWHNAPIIHHLQLRESTIQIPIGLGTARLGRMPIKWGMGLVVHDGRGLDDPFDDPRGGDIVNGAWIDVKPLLPFVQNRLAHGLRLGLGADIVEQDEMTHRSGGDLAWRLAGSITWEEPWLTGGVYMMMRELERDNDERATHYVFDATCRYTTRFADRFGLIVEGEAAIVTGAISTPASDGRRDSKELEQMGAVARVTLKDEALHASYAVELGYASGDPDPSDDRDTAFRFDPARRVGMLIFDEVLSRLSAQDAERARTMGVDTSPPTLPTNGAVTNTLYVAPKVDVELCDGCLSLRAGGVFAFAPEPITALGTEALTDEEARGLLGAKAKAGTLGYELNAGASMALEVSPLVHFSLGTQYGFFVPGAALSAADPEHELGVVHKWRLLADVTW